MRAEALVALATLLTLLAQCRGQVPSVLTPAEGEVLQLSGFGAELTPSLLPPLWEAEGVYVANHSARVRQWRHATRPNLILTFEPFTAPPTAPHRWIVLDLGPDKDVLGRNPPIAELPRAGPRPWERSGGGWLARDCLDRLRATPAELSGVTELRRRDSCGTLTWRLAGLGEQHASLAPLAGRYRATDRYSAGAPVYRADSGAELLRLVNGTRSDWVLRAAADDAIQMAALHEFADRVNLIRTERFVAATLPGRDLRDQPVFVCMPGGWESGDADFTVPDLDGYATIEDPADAIQWSRQPFAEEDVELYRRAFGGRPERHARVMVAENVTRARLGVAWAQLESPRIQLTGAGCAQFRLRNAGFRLTVTLVSDDGSGQTLLNTSSVSGWRDVVVPLPGPGRVLLTASQPDDPADRLAVSQILAFNETCNQLQGRASACQRVSCLNGGTCASVTIKHHLCLCPTAFIGERCETRVDCGPPPEITSGRVTHVSGTAYLDRAYYHCQAGHALAETVLGLAWSSCHHNGTWVNIPHCDPLPDALQPQPYLECLFGGDCTGFNTRLDNDYNTATDTEWQRTERLQTTDIRPEGAFLTAYRSWGNRRITARLRTPCLDLADAGCLRLDVYLSNATLQLRQTSSDRLLLRTTEVGRGRLLALPPQVGPLMLVVELMSGEAEAALDVLRVYRHTCDELRGLDGDAEAAAWPTWPPLDQTGERVNATERPVEKDTTSTGSPLTTPILLVLVPLLVVLGILMVLGCRKK